MAEGHRPSVVMDGILLHSLELETTHLSKLEELRERFNYAWNEMRGLLRAVRAPLPTQTGDGSELSPITPVNRIVGDIEIVMRDLAKMGIRDIDELAHVVKSAALDNPLNDKMYYMEYMIQAAAKLSQDLVRADITSTFVQTLWNDLQHPPETLLGPEFQFRYPDGSRNNFQLPQIGAAGMTYARTVPPRSMRNGALPDPSVLFDTLMARKNPKGTEHPTRISSMLFYLASIIIHDVFRTDSSDYNVSKTSSYLDLAPLYGSNWEEQKQMRTFKDGKIKPDCFSETRLLSFPPGVGALLIMFNRFHNDIVENLAAINEDGRFTENPKKPDVERYGETINKRDDDLFQTGRLVTCGLYVNIILLDYVRTILNLNRTDHNWKLDPREKFEDGPPQGTGNQVSAEFNLVYRWHAAISHRDDLWTQELWKELFPDLSAEESSTPEGMRKVLMGLAAEEKKLEALDPMDRPWPATKADTLQRNADGPYKGRYKDNDLAEIITAGIEDCANAFGPQQVPTVMKVIEIMGITQARSWHCATLNEFRKHFSLQPHHTFESISENQEVVEALKHFYDTPDQVELYPGLVVEGAKVPMRPGSGLCPSYTVSRAILSDAVALVRGDRFYTTSYHPASLTNFGYHEAASSLNVDNGCVMYKLLLRGLPNNFDPASVYVHYPFTTPQGHDGMQDVLESLGKAHRYNFDRPKPRPIAKTIFSCEAAKQILGDDKNFHVTWGSAMEFLMGPAVKDFCLAGDGFRNQASRELMENALYLDDGGPDASRALPSGHEKWYTAVRDYYEDITTRLLRDRTYKAGSANEVDIIRDIGNMTHVHFCAEMFSLPLKTEDFPRGVFTEKELYMVMAAISISIFFDVDPSKTFALRQQAFDATRTVGDMMQFQVAVVKETGAFAEWFINAVKPVSKSLRDYGVHMIRKMVRDDPDVDDLVWGNIMGTLGCMVANPGQLFGQAMDYFFTEGKEHLPAINKLAKEDTPEADDKLLHYLLEATRLNCETSVFRWAEKDITIVDKTAELGTVTHEFKKGDKIMINLQSASRDPVAFPEPDKMDLTRPIESYIQFGYGAHQCLGLPMARVALTTMLKVVGRLDNLRPAPVTIGKSFTHSTVKKVAKEFETIDPEIVPESWRYHAYLTEDWEMYFPYPTSLKVYYDGPLPEVAPEQDV